MGSQLFRPIATWMWRDMYHQQHAFISNFFSSPDVNKRALLDDLDTNPVTTELLELAEQEQVRRAFVEVRLAATFIIRFARSYLAHKKLQDMMESDDPDLTKAKKREVPAARNRQKFGNPLNQAEQCRLPPGIHCSLIFLRMASMSSS